MTQANEPGTDEPTPQFAARREIGAAPGTEQRASRVLLRIPDCTSRLSTISGASAGWWLKASVVGSLGGPWFDMLRPVLPPRVLAAGAIGILLGVVLILLTPADKRSPGIHAHTEQATNGQRAIVPAQPLEEPNGPRANIGTTTTGNAGATAAVQPNSSAKIDTAAPPRYENARRPADVPPTPGAGWAELEGRLN